MEFLLAAGAQADLLGARFRTAHLRSHTDGARTVKSARGRVVLRIGEGQFDGIAVIDGRLAGHANIECDGLESFTGFVRRARGNFMVFAEHGDELFVAADRLGTYPLFYYDGDPFLLSNSVFLIEDALGLLDVDLSPNLELFGWEATLLNCWFDQTGFEEVRLFPIGAIAVASPSGVRFVEPPLTDLLYSDLPFDELIDAAADEILENVRALAGGDFTHRVCDLTGGLDSRLVLAALLREGVEDRFAYGTSGAYPNPDVNVARMLRQRFGLTRAVNAHPPNRDLSLLDRTRSYLASTFGTYTMLMNVGVDAPPSKDVLRLHGGLGETFRRAYTAALGSSTTSRMQPFYAEIDSRGHLLAPEVRKEQKAAVGEWSKALEAEGVGGGDLLDVAYIAHRNRYHFGLTWRAGNISRSSFHPLYSPAAIQAAYALPIEERNTNRVGYELMRRFCPELVELPFAVKGWPDSIHQGVAPITRKSAKLFHEAPDPTVRLFPPKSRSRESHSTSAWELEVRRSGLHPKLALLERMLDEMRPLLSEPVDALAPVFVPDQVRAFLDRKPHDFIAKGQRSRNAYAVNRLFGALVWVNRLCPGPPSRPAETASRCAIDMGASLHSGSSSN